MVWLNGYFSENVSNDMTPTNIEICLSPPIEFRPIQVVAIPLQGMWIDEDPLPWGLGIAGKTL